MHYFAYGTLLDLPTMRKLAPSAKPVGIMRLDGFRLGFAMCGNGRDGGCTLHADSAAATHGMQYELTDEDMAAMDKAAGIDRSLWMRKAIKVIDSSGATIDTVTYVVPDGAPPFAPSDDYVRPILKGLAELDMDARYRATVAEIIARAQAA